MFGNLSHRYWSRINDYLLEVGSEPNLEGFCQKTFVKLDNIIPIDNSATFFGASPLFQPYIRGITGLSEKVIKDYNKYYWASNMQLRLKYEPIMPINWHDYLECLEAAELANDCKILSKHEAEVASLICQRLTMAEIGTKLMLSPRTVHTHIEHINDKLGVRTR